MKGLPKSASKSFLALNQHLYGKEAMTNEPRDGMPVRQVPEHPVAVKAGGAKSGKNTRKSILERMNKTEHRCLERLKQLGHHDAQPWRITLRLANGVRLTVDFYVPHTMGKPTFVECKGGYVRPDSMVKLRLAASQFPEFDFIVHQWKDKKWAETPIKP